MRLAASLVIVGLVLAGCGAIVGHRAAEREVAAEAAFPPEGRLLTVAGRQVHTVVLGEGPDLVLIHGASGSTRDFTHAFAGRMAQEYRVIVFDRPGHGYTDRTDPDYDLAFTSQAESPAEQAALLQAAAAQLGADRPIVLGHSYGASVALAWALQHPDNISALVDVSGATMPWPGGLGPIYTVPGSTLGGAVVPLITAFATDDRIEAAIAGVFAPNDPPEGYADHIGAPLSIRRDAFRANARQVNSLRPHVVAMSARYPTLDLPVEIVHGDRDETVPLAIHSQPLSRLIPGANLTVLEGVGHMPHHIAPEAVAAAIHRAAERAGLR